MIEDVNGELVPAEKPAQPRALARDRYVVETSDLTPVVRGFVSTWKQSRPSDAARFRSGEASLTASAGSTFVGPYDWLSQESGVDRETLRNIARGPSRRRFTSFAEAEAILVTALERPDLLARVVVVERATLTGDGATR